MQKKTLASSVSFFALNPLSPRIQCWESGERGTSLGRSGRFFCNIKCASPCLPTLTLGWKGLASKSSFVLCERAFFLHDPVPIFDLVFGFALCQSKVAAPSYSGNLELDTRWIGKRFFATSPIGEVLILYSKEARGAFGTRVP